MTATCARALILCNGEPPSDGLLVRHLQAADLLICTDGASGWVQAHGVRPHVLIGDMDSRPGELECEVIDAGTHDTQENSDAEKALLLALARGARQIVLLGATGLRLDHTLGNLALAQRYHLQAEVVLADDFGELRVISQPWRLPVGPGARVSLLALTPDVTLDTHGLKWPIHGPLEVGTRGLSNEVAGEQPEVEVHTGVVAVVLLSDSLPA